MKRDNRQNSIPLSAPTPTAVTTYQLTIKVPTELRITIGRLGKFSFPAGDYVYTGSAKTNIDARIERHLRKEKTLRWHIDYLLAHRQVQITKVTRHASPECTVNKQVSGIVVVKKFGASDCKSGCGSHLKRLIDS